MPQQRFYDYSKPASSTYENAIHYALNNKGVYRGMGLGIDATYGGLQIDAGYALQHDGVIWYESTAIVLPFEPPTAATVYTVVATHADRAIIGGVAVEYDILTGEFTNEDVTNGVAIGWIYHPGAATPLALEHLVSAPKALPEDYAKSLAQSLPIELLPPLQQSVVTSSGLDITFAPSVFDAVNYVIYQDVQNSPTAVGVESLVQQVQFFVQGSTAVRPYSFSFYHNFTTVVTTEITAEVYDTSQSPTVFSTGGTTATVTGTGGWSESTVVLDRTDGTFDVAKPYTLRLTYNVAPGESLQLGRIKANYWPFP